MRTLLFSFRICRHSIIFRSRITPCRSTNLFSGTLHHLLTYSKPLLFKGFEFDIQRGDQFHTCKCPSGILESDRDKQSIHSNLFKTRYGRFINYQFIKWPLKFLLPPWAGNSLPRNYSTVRLPKSLALVKDKNKDNFRYSMQLYFLPLSSRLLPAIFSFWPDLTTRSHPKSPFYPSFFLGALST